MQEQEEEMAPPQSVTMDQWNDMKEMDPPKDCAYESTQHQSGAQQEHHHHFNDQFRRWCCRDTANENDYGLSCTGLLGEELLMDTSFGQFARASLQATAESLRKLSEAVVKPIKRMPSRMKLKLIT